MSKTLLLNVYIVAALIGVTRISAFEKELTIYIDAGKKECFYQFAKEGDTIDLEYQVIDGGHGDLDISFSMSEPIGLLIATDFKKSENVHRHKVMDGKSGDYSFCFDNTFSTFNTKTVFFELIVEKEGGGDGDNTINDSLEGLTPEEFYDMKVQDIMDYIGRIRMSLNKARQIQDMLRSNEARDRNIAEANFLKVNLWSLIQICVMVAVGALQVFMVRSIFDTDTKVRKWWDKIGRFG